MRNLWLVVLLAVALLTLNKWYRESSHADGGLRAESRSANARPGGPVRQIERRPSEVMEMQSAMPQGGVSTRAMVDTARQAGQR